MKEKEEVDGRLLEPGRDFLFRGKVVKKIQKYNDEGEEEARPA